jgi:hypothetical protein
MKNLETFLENADSAADRLSALKDRQDKFKDKEKSFEPTGTFDTTDAQQNADAEKAAEAEREQLKKEIKRELATEELGTGLTITGPRAKRSTADRRKPDAKPRVKAVGGGKTAPVDYKPQGEKPNRSGNNKTSNTTQQPTKERGSAEVKQSYADKVKAERRAAAKARAAAKKSGGEVKTTKTSAKDTTKAADKLLSTKKAKTVSPDYKPAKASGYTRAERDKIKGKGERMLKGIFKDQETAKYKKETGVNPDAKGRQKILGRVNKRMK